MDASIEWWDWIGIASGILAVVALMMATPTLFQMAWGRPKVSLEFDNDYINSSKILQCSVSNQRVNKMFRSIGIRRDVAHDVWAMFEIQEKGSGTIKVPREMAMFTGRMGEDGSAHVSVHSGTIGRRFGIVAQSPEDKTGLVLSSDKENQVKLPAGTYTVSVNLVASEKRTDFQRDFTLDTSGGLYWLSQ